MPTYPSKNIAHNQVTLALGKRKSASLRRLSLVSVVLGFAALNAAPSAFQNAVAEVQSSRNAMPIIT